MFDFLLEAAFWWNAFLVMVGIASLLLVFAGVMSRSTSGNEARHREFKEWQKSEAEWALKTQERALEREQAARKAMIESKW